MANTKQSTRQPGNPDLTTKVGKMPQQQKEKSQGNRTSPRTNAKAAKKAADKNTNNAKSGRKKVRPHDDGKASATDVAQGGATSKYMEQPQLLSFRVTT